MDGKSIRIAFKSGMLFKMFTVAAAFWSLLALAPCRADDIQVTVSIDKMHCLQPTETGLNNRDEVYIIVKTKGSEGSDAKRLPHPDDYYEFWKGTEGQVRGWTNQNQKKQGKPMLLHADLAPGQTAQIYVAVGEQDNKDLPAIGRMIIKVSEVAIDAVSDAFGEPEIGKIATGVLNKVSGLIKDNSDDQIGYFALVLKNENGKLKQVWVPGKFTAKGGETGSFECHGTSKSAYNLHVAVESKTVPAGTPLPK